MMDRRLSTDAPSRCRDRSGTITLVLWTLMWLCVGSAGSACLIAARAPGADSTPWCPIAQSPGSFSGNPNRTGELFMEESQNYVGAFECHGVEFTRTSGIQRIGTCPFCDKENHFHANQDTGQWDCKACGESGNVITFLGKIAELWHEETSEQDFKALAELRGIPATTLKKWGLGWDGDYWLIPARAPTGQVHDLRRWDPGSKKILSTSGCRTQLFGSDRLANSPAGTPVWLTEGEWDAMMLDHVFRTARSEDVVVGVPGAGTFKREWAPLFEGRVVNIVYDNDDAGRKGTEKAARALAAKATAMMAIVWPEETPDGYDVRDLLIEGRGKRRSAKSLLADLSTMLQGLEAPAGPDPSEPDDAERKITDPHVLADDLIDRHYSHRGEVAIRFFRGGWWLWEGACYRAIEESELRALVNRQALATLNRAGNRKYVDRSLVGNVLRAMEGMCLVKSTVDLPAWIGPEPRPGSGDLLAMRNALVDLEAALTGNDCEHDLTPAWFSVTAWQFDFDPAAGCPRWKRFLREVLPSPAARFLLQEFLGHCLTVDLSHHRFLVLVGEGANGKSVVTHVATHVLGPGNVTHIGLERFNDRFSLSTMVGKLANIVSELGPVRGVAEDYLKAIVSGDRIQVEMKYRPAYFVLLTTRLLFATNEMPRFSDRSSGLWRRLLVLPFKVTIPDRKQDRRLAQRICEEEAPGVFNWMLTGLRRLRDRGAFTIPRTSKQALEEHRQASNPAREFLTEACVASHTATVKCSTLYAKYARWCDAQRIRPLTKQQFGQEVRRIFPDVAREQRRAPGGRHYVYVGLAVEQPSGRRTGR